MTIDDIMTEEGKLSKEHMKNMTESEKEIYNIGYTDGMRYQNKITKWKLVNYEYEYSKKVNEGKKT